MTQDVCNASKQQRWYSTEQRRYIGLHMGSLPQLSTCAAQTHVQGSFGEESKPSRVIECGLAGSRSLLACTGYHCLFQSSTSGVTFGIVSGGVVCVAPSCSVETQKCN